QRPVATCRLGRHPDELLECGPRIGPLEEFTRVRQQLVEADGDNCGTQRVLRREAPEDAAVPDAGPARDLGDRHIRPGLGVPNRGGGEEAVEVALRVGAEDGHQAATTTGSSEAACCSIRATWRLRRSASMTPRAATMITAPVAKAQWKPTTSASVAVPPADAVLLVAMVDRMARPSAPPICCDVLNNPDASPWSSSFSPVVAMSVSGMNTAPIPSDESRIEGRTSAAYDPCTGSCVSSRRPAVVSSIPAAATGRTPIRGANAEANPAETMSPAVNGRNARPAFSGP